MGNDPGSRPSTLTAPVLSPEIKNDIEMWLSTDVEKRNGSLARLVSRGATAAPHLVESMFQNATNLGRQSQLQTALREIGSSASAPVRQALSRIPGVKKSEDVAMIEDLTETLLQIDGKRAIDVAQEQIAKLNTVPLKNRVLAEHINNARLRLVLKLATTGCPEAIDEAIAYLGDGTMLVPLALFDVLEKSGDARALARLLKLHPRQIAASEVSGRKLEGAFKAIAKREKVGADAACFKEIGKAEKELLEKWLKR